MTRPSFVALVAFSIIASFACQKEEKKPATTESVSPPTGGGGGGTLDGSVTIDGSTGVCPPLSNDAAIVGERYVDQTVPIPLGGVIAAGTYFLTTVTVYTGVGGNTGLTGRNFQETLVLDATTFTDVRAISDNEGGTGVPADTNGTYSTSLTTFALTPVCPAGGVGRNDPFTVSANLLHLFEGQSEYIYSVQ